MVVVVASFIGGDFGEGDFGEITVVSEGGGVSIDGDGSVSITSS